MNEGVLPQIDMEVLLLKIVNKTVRLRKAGLVP